MINKHINIFVGVQLNNKPVTSWKLYMQSHNAECMVERQTEDLWRKGWSWLLCHLHILTQLYSVMTASISCLYFRHLSMNWSNSKKWLSEVSATCTPFFRALTVSWGLDMSESSSCSPSAVCYSRSSSSSVNSAAGEPRMPQLSVSSTYGNPMGTFCANMRVFYFILPVGKSLEVINSFRLKLCPTAIQSYWLSSSMAFFILLCYMISSIHWYYERSPASSHPWCCRVHSEGSNAWISQWLLGCVATVVRWFSWEYSVWLFWWARPKSCRFKDNEALQCQILWLQVPLNLMKKSNCWTNPAITASSTKPPYLISLTLANDLFSNN